MKTGKNRKKKRFHRKFKDNLGLRDELTAKIAKPFPIMSAEEYEEVRDYEELVTEFSYNKKDVKKFEKETGKHAIWRGKVTKGFKDWVAKQG